MNYGPNSVKCADCGVILTSEHVHDYKTCHCPNRAMIDGGNQYHRLGGKDMSKVLRYVDGRGWVAYTLLRAERESAERIVNVLKPKHTKPKKQTKVTISKKEYDELNYKLRHSFQLAIDNQSLRRQVEANRDNPRGVEAIAGHVEWIDVIANYDEAIYNTIEGYIYNNLAMSAVKAIRVVIKHITGFEPNLSLSKAVLDKWRAKCK